LLVRYNTLTAEADQNGVAIGQEARQFELASTSEKSFWPVFTGGALQELAQ
jgi:hypothetical protein